MGRGIMRKIDKVLKVGKGCKDIKNAEGAGMAEYATSWRSHNVAVGQQALASATHGIERPHTPTTP